MQLAVGNIVEGKVTGITKFGAFVELPGGKTGMVHISEVAPTYVNEIRDHVTENQVVKVKILNITEEGKISLSMKRAMDRPLLLQGVPRRVPIVWNAPTSMIGTAKRKMKICRLKTCSANLSRPVMTKCPI